MTTQKVQTQNLASQRPALRFPDFQNDGGWEVKRLGEVCRLTNGMAFKPSDWIETGIPIVRIQNLNDENAPFNYCAPEIIDDRCMIDTGTLLFSWSGTPGTSFGAFIWNRGKAVLNQHIFIVKPVEIDKVFLKMAIDANMTSIIEKSHGGAGLRHITKSDFEDIRISVPKDIAEQRRIAQALTALDEIIAATNEKLEQMKAYKKGLMQQLFANSTIGGGKSLNINHLKIPSLRFPEFANEKEWEEKMVKDICSIGTGKSNTQDQVKEGIYPFFIRSEHPVRSNKYLYDCEAVITIGDGKIGQVFHYVNGKFDLHQRCYKMSDFRGVDGKFFFYFFSAYFYERAMRMTAKATVDSVRLEMISDMPISLPTLPEQRKIALCLSSMDETINAYTEKADLLAQYKKGLMQQMFANTACRDAKFCVSTQTTPNDTDAKFCVSTNGQTNVK